MSLQHNFNLLARYNQWMNNKLYELASALNPDELLQNRGAFFGSVAGILNHLLVADLIWLNRYRQLAIPPSVLQQLSNFPVPVELDQLLYADFNQLHGARKQLDELLLSLSAELNEQHLQQVLSYKNMKGELMRKPFSSLLQHLFNHQTHHRGQLTTLFSQMGLDVGVTDLLMLIDNEPADNL
ncbi:DinB family protein [Rheinheimera sp. 1928-s]|uniref:DinB family protein n=1 Tax=Rheinheimera sp. 1928-s TaxID=3033803 RepID=UPI00261B418D|nr:DinB family protein [Rheinheimera sp. 1928-s]MDF3123667.1 DinB family protein [Rheinheimera sp. 1928-s]